MPLQKQLPAHAIRPPARRRHVGRFSVLHRTRRYPTAVSAPCPLCGDTAQATQYDAQGNKTREVAHDGSVTFYAYNTKGQETERATFPLAYQSAQTRPALRFATSVTSTRWHATWNLPTQIAAPGQITSSSYSASGNLTGISTVATTDATGAAKFGAVKTGPINATGYAYNAGGLNTAIVQRVNNVESQRWTLAYNALGDLTKITDVTGGNVSATLSNDAHGRMTSLAASNGASASFARNSDGQLTSATLPGYSASLSYDGFKRLSEVRLSTGHWLQVTYNANGEPTQVLNSSGQVRTASGPALHWLQSNDPLGAFTSLLTGSLRESMHNEPQRLSDALIKPAQAQVPLFVPPNLAGGLSAAGGLGASRALNQGLPPGACCDLRPPTSAEMQANLQLALPSILIGQTAISMASETIDILTNNILAMKGRVELKKNMECPTQPYYQPKPPGCWEAHHIVAFGHPRAKRARDVLISVGIDINSPANGVWMACAAHRGMHTYLYYDKVNELLDLAPKNKLSIEAELAMIRGRLQSGTFLP